MNKIIVLDENTINQIAAGEVIEKPASVVKELVENSLDAGAGKISIFIEGGGLKKIKVIDNGRGLDNSQFDKVFQRYATSKLTTIDDLYRLTTMGFRGEALASIASVSKVTFTSRTVGSDIGYTVSIAGGETIDKKEVAVNQGTTVIVEELFYNTPVRQKFLNSQFKETKDVISIVEKLFLSRPDIKMELYVDSELLFKSKGNNEIKELASIIFSLTTAKSMLYLEGEAQGIKIKALVGGIHQYRGNKEHIVFFINNRYVIHKGLSKYFIDAYQNRLPINRYPIGIIYIDAPPFALEVNIHPRKIEVKIEDENIVGELLKNLVIDRLNSEKTEQFQQTKALQEQTLIKESLSFDFSQQENNQPQDTLFNDEYPSSNINNPFRDVEVFGTFKDSYVLASLKDELFIIDQHAAHERINFEKVQLEFINSGFKSQLLMEAIVVDLSKRDYLKVISYIDKLRSYGVILEEFGENTFIIRGLPLGIQASEGNREFLLTLIDKIDTGTDSYIKDYMLEKASCVRSVKAGEKINIIELKSLIIQLGECDNPFTCPHGRPIFLRYTLHDLEKLFLRS